VVGKCRLILVVVCLLAACSGRGSIDSGATVERYLQAKVAGDGETIRRLLCHRMEVDYEREWRSFEAVSEAHLEGVACRPDADGSTVRCQGKIVAAYGTEQSEFPLSAYRVVWEDGEWKWCGEAP
jgi:hypothetical protein